MRWHRKLKTLLPVRPIEKRNRHKHRVLLQLEELETRALLSVSSATPIQPTTTPTKNEVVPPSTNPATTQNAFPLLAVKPQSVSAQQTSGPPSGSYTPLQIQQAYGFDQLPATINGAGETIAIIDAFYDPNITSDANTFSSQFGLPQLLPPGSSGGPTLTVVASGGGAASSLSQDPTGGWPLETSLDVEWAHAMAPQANILLVEAPDESNTSMFNAVQYAASQPGVVAVSMSWGVNEFPGETSFDSTFIPPSTNPGVAFVAASGDYGAGAIYPAASPYVLSVGGTTLGGSTGTTGGFGTSGFGTSGFGTSGFGSSSFFSWGSSWGTFFARSASARPGGGLYAGSGSLSITPDASSGGGSNPNYPGESAWFGSGGGPSADEGYPSYQFDQPWIAQNYDSPGTLYNVEVTNQTTGATNYYSARMTSDVAYNTVNYAIYDSIPSPAYGTVAGWNEVDGTSAAAPQWSAILALADQERADAGQPALSTTDALNALYNTLGSSPTNSVYTSVFNDITTGSNGYAAGPGYDLATGLGTPIVNNLVPLLANAPGGTSFTVTGSGYGGTSGGFSSGFGSSSFSSGFFGFAAGAQPGGGLFAGSGSLSLAPVSQGASLNGQSGGASVTPQANLPQAPVANSLTFSLATTGAATTDTVTSVNNLVGNISTLAPASPSTATAGNSAAATATNAPLAQANAVFGASGWKGVDLSWHLNSLDLPSAQIAPPADDSSANSEDGIDGSSGDALLSDTDSFGEDWSELEFIAPAHPDDSDAGDGGDGGDGGGDG